MAHVLAFWKRAPAPACYASAFPVADNPNRDGGDKVREGAEHDAPFAQRLGNRTGGVLKTGMRASWPSRVKESGTAVRCNRQVGRHLHTSRRPFTAGNDVGLCSAAPNGYVRSASAVSTAVAAMIAVQSGASESERVRDR